jgi:hypothetical protein
VIDLCPSTPGSPTYRGPSWRGRSRRRGAACAGALRAPGRHRGALDHQPVVVNSDPLADEDERGRHVNDRPPGGAARSESGGLKKRRRDRLRGGAPILNRPNWPSDFATSVARRGAASTAARDRSPHPQEQYRPGRSRSENDCPRLSFRSDCSASAYWAHLAEEKRRVIGREQPRQIV